MIDQHIETALQNDRVVDITTIGRKSGQPRRIEIWLYYEGDGVGYLFGTVGKRDWLANLRANPDFTIHVKRGAQADLPGRAEEITDPAERREVIARLYGRTDGEYEQRVEHSPLMRVRLL